MAKHSDEPKWLTVLYAIGWTFIWLFFAVTMLMCMFGGMVYTWRG